MLILPSSTETIGPTTHSPLPTSTMHLRVQALSAFTPPRSSSTIRNSRDLSHWLPDTRLPMVRRRQEPPNHRLVSSLLLVRLQEMSMLLKRQSKDLVIRTRRSRIALSVVLQDKTLHPASTLVNPSEKSDIDWCSE